MKSQKKRNMRMMTSDGARMRRYCESAKSNAILDKHRKANNKQRQKKKKKRRPTPRNPEPGLSVS